MEDHPLIGIWKLVAMERIDTSGNVTEVEVITGMLMYTNQGWMSEGLEYRMPDSGEVTRMFYSGLYEIHGETVIHQPRIHTDHQLVWTELPRQFEMSGNRFTLVARNPNGASYLVWEKLMV